MAAAALIRPLAWEPPCAVGVALEKAKRQKKKKGMDKDVVHIYNGILLGSKNKIMSFAATWIALEIIILSEVNHRQISYHTTYMWNLKYTNELIYKTETN